MEQEECKSDNELAASDTQSDMIYCSDHQQLQPISSETGEPLQLPFPINIPQPPTPTPQDQTYFVAYNNGFTQGYVQGYYCGMNNMASNANKPVYHTRVSSAYRGRGRGGYRGRGYSNNTRPTYGPYVYPSQTEYTRPQFQQTPVETGTTSTGQKYILKNPANVKNPPEQQHQ